MYQDTTCDIDIPATKIIGIKNIALFGCSLMDAHNDLIIRYFDNSTTANWSASQYSTTPGTYNSALLNYISESAYKGDWIVVKFPYQIILSKFTFYQNTSSTTSAPGLWKCYGSSNGSNWNIITEACNTTATAVYSNAFTYINNAITSNYYTQRLNTTFTTPYLYIGWTFNTLSGTGTQLSFNEFQIFGEIYNPILTKTLDIDSSITSVSISGDGSGLNNLKLENQTNFIYPPISLYSNYLSLTKSLTNVNYGNGIYSISASSYGTGKDPYYCFDKTLITNDWSPSGTPYTALSGIYSSTTYSTIVSGTIYYGEWIQIYYDKGFTATTFTITGITTNNNKCPSNFILAGSIDSYNWVLLSTQTGIIDYAIIPSKTFSIYNYTSYNYYRLIITKTVSDTTLSISEISFTGTQNTSFTNLDSYISTVYNTNEKQFPPRLYDIASPETQVLNEIFNCLPLNPYKQTLTLNNHGIYTLYSSSTDSTSLKQILFDYDITYSGTSTSAHWNFTPPYRYTTNDGYYNTLNYNSYISDSNYKGDWIIVKLPSKIILTRFRFYARYNAISRSPGLWKCYGSNDGINFTEIKDASNTITSLSISSYSTNNYYEKVLPNIFDIPYLYIGWVINKLAGGDSVAYLLNFIELQIFGKDDISNTYSKLLQYTNNKLIIDNPSTITTLTTTSNNYSFVDNYVKINYTDEYYIGTGTYNITFTPITGLISINTPTIINNYSYPIIKDINPIVWFKFDNPNFLLDYGSLNNGSLTSYGATIDTSVFVKNNGSAKFVSASSQYLTMPTNIDLNAINITTGISFTFWARITSASATAARIFDFGQQSGNNGINFIIIFRDGTTSGLSFFINNTTNFSFLTSSITPVVNYLDSTWRHYVWTISTTGVWNIYINNINIHSSTKTIIPYVASGSRTYYIGKSLFTGDGYFDMNVDDFRIYNKVLSASEVSELYNGRIDIYKKINTGIGTTNPQYLLDINGPINANNYIGDGSLLTNFKLENQSNFIYPPSSLTSLTSNNITSSSYGNGIYYISASSYGTGKEAFYCFDKTLITNDWSPSGTPYSGTSGAYTSTPIYSTIVSGSIYYGEWIQLYYDKGFAATTFTITGITTNNNKCPSNFILAGSTNQQNWVLLSTQTAIIDYTTIPSKTFSIYNYTSYNYYRLIITKTVSDTSLSISEISFTGTQNTSFTNLDSYISTVYNTNEKQFPPRLYDIVSGESQVLNEIFNCIPLNPYKETLTLNNHGIYTIYSSSSIVSSGYKSLLFNYNTTYINSSSDSGGSHWYYSGGNGTYTQPNGTYIQSNGNYISDPNYKGDWIIVKLPSKIILTRFRFYPRFGFVGRSPGLWKCYGSNDGINFTEIIDASNTITSLSISSYSTNNYYEKVLPNIFDIPYLYIGWVINKLAGGNSDSYILNFIELQIYGKDDICNSFLNVWNKNNTTIYNTLGNVGIGTINPQSLFHINGTNPILTIMGQGGLNAISQINLTTFNNPGYTASCSLIATDNGTGGNSFQINLKTSGNINNPQFTPFYISTSGNIGIGTNNPQYNIDLYDATMFNNKPFIRLSGGGGANTNQVGIILNPYFGRTAAVATKIYAIDDGDASAHLCFATAAAGTTNEAVERMRIENNGLIKTTGDIDCGGGIALTGSTAFYETSAINPQNLTNTYINFKFAGTGSDWCYIRQIGTTNAYKLAFDFHDDEADARFCIRKIQSAAQSTDIIDEVFTVDNGNVTATGKINSLTNLQENSVNLSSKYLKLDGTNTMTSGLKFNNLVQNNVISLYDASPANNFQFVGLGANSGLILNTFGSSDSFQFRVGASTTTANELMRLSGTGNLSLGTTETGTYKCRIRGSNPTLLRIETNYSDIGQVSGIEFGIPAFNSASSAKITSTTFSGDVADLQFSTSASSNASSVKMTITGGGNVGIGTSTNLNSNFTVQGTSLFTGNSTFTGQLNPNNILQVGSDGRLRIGNGQSDYTKIGTIDIDTNATNTKIFINGTTCSYAGAAGCIQYFATGSTGSHIFYNGIAEKVRINNSGDITCAGTISCTGTTLTVGNSSASSTLYLTDISGAAWKIFTYNSNLNFWNNTGGTFSNKMILSSGGNLTLGTTTVSTTTKLTLYDATRFNPRITLSGEEFYLPSAGATTLTEGLSFLLGVNRTNNKQLWIGNSTLLTSNATNAVLRLGVGASYCTIDCGATNGTTSLPIYFGSGAAITYIQGSTINISGDMVSSNNTATFTKLSTISSTSFVGAPGIGTTGAANGGDKFILYTGSATVHPYALGIDSSTLWYSVPTGSQHKFYINGTNTLSLSPSQLTTNTSIHCDGSINIRSATNVACSLMFRTTDYNLGIAGANGNYSSSAVQNDMILRTLVNTNLIFQSGSGACAIKIDSSNTTNINGILSISANLSPWTNNSVHSVFFASDTSNGSLKIAFPASANIAYGGNPGHHLMFGPFSVNANTSFTSYLTIDTTNGRVGVCKFPSLSPLDVNGNIYMNGSLVSASDSRIKTNIQDINDDNALQKILQIQPKTYEYIDKKTRGYKVVYGFIAQQIQEVLPDAVLISNESIPNIYKECECSDNIITFDETVNINLFNIDSKIILMDDTNNQKPYTITEIIQESNQIKLNENIQGSNCFVYGTEVNDFHALNKDYIFTLNVCATQELHRIIQQQQEQINSLIRRIEILESR